MVKTIISASVDLEPLTDCRAQRKNISAICNKAIWEASRCPPDTSKIETLRKEADKIEDIQGQIQKEADIRHETRLDEFLKLNWSITNNPVALEYWAKETGKTMAELRALKAKPKTATNEPPKP